MDIIKQYKKIFIGVLVVAALFCMIPILGMSFFMMGGSSSSQATSEIQLEPGETNHLLKLRVLEAPTYSKPAFKKGKASLSCDKTFDDGAVLEGTLCEVYLEEGTLVEVVYKSKNIDSEAYWLHLVGGNGTVYQFNGTPGTKLETSYVVKESGNYAFAYQGNFNGGQLEMKVTLTEAVNEGEK